MNLHDQWKALSARIHGLTKAAQFLSQFTPGTETIDIIRVQLGRVVTSLDNFKSRFRNTLSSGALASIDDAVEKIGPIANDASGSREARHRRLKNALVMLGAFESEFSFLLSDIQQLIRSRAELAFSHLQRLIVVDEEFRAKWNAAFEKGEVACEGLGAVHLLQHGIWAFKVDAAGARTDLVFQDPISELANVQRYADGLVLTEWKKANSPTEAERRFEEARSQARLYAEGPLASTELTGFRYAIVVSREQVSTPDDVTEAGVIYRHINIAVEPRTPSRASRN